MKEDIRGLEKAVSKIVAIVQRLEEKWEEEGLSLLPRVRDLENIMTNLTKQYLQEQKEGTRFTSHTNNNNHEEQMEAMAASLDGLQKQLGFLPREAEVGQHQKAMTLPEVDAELHRSVLGLTHEVEGIKDNTTRAHEKFTKIFSGLKNAISKLHSSNETRAMQERLSRLEATTNGLNQGWHHDDLRLTQMERAVESLKGSVNGNQNIDMVLTNLSRIVSRNHDNLIKNERHLDSLGRELTDLTKMLNVLATKHDSMPDVKIEPRHLTELRQNIEAIDRMKNADLPSLVLSVRNLTSLVHQIERRLSTSGSGLSRGLDPRFEYNISDGDKEKRPLDVHLLPEVQNRPNSSRANRVDPTLNQVVLQMVITSVPAYIMPLKWTNQLVTRKKKY